MYYKAILIVIVAVLSVHWQQVNGQPVQQVKKTPVVVDKGSFGPNGQRIGLMSAPMRHRYGYDAMHIHGKPFVTCNHPAFKFGCAHMTYPQKFMNQHQKLINGARVEHKDEAVAEVPRDTFLQFAMQKGWSVKKSAYRGKPLGYKGPGQI